ncbi:MAG: metal-dependent hydrolase [Gammaproteobacteria bacterium]|nr:metal-dependent hydrolase [Gammaproteobacteria bacterium]
MDPVSQGALGATLASAGVSARRVASIALLGGVSGMAPDLDFLVRSSTDPLLFLEYHRQFTHALLFIPAGAGLCTLLLYGFVRRHLTWRVAYLACLLGYATHGVLDACTSYGTQLFWPFSDVRVSWNVVSVVDPLFTVPLLALLAAAVWMERVAYARMGAAWAIAYLLVGAVQHDRAVAAGHALAAARGHTPVRLEAKPSFANLLVWKVIYEYQHRYYVDAARLGRQVSYCPGTSVAALNIAASFPWLDAHSQQAVDVERFRWFSNDYLALDPADATHIVDVRYSTLPNEISALWGVAVDAGAPLSAHVRFVSDSTRRVEHTPKLVAMILGRACEPL